MNLLKYLEGGRRGLWGKKACVNECFHLLVHSTNDPSSWGWTTTRARSLERLPGLPGGWQAPKLLAVSHCFPTCIGRGLDWEWSNWLVSHGGRQWLNSLHHDANPGHFFLPLYKKYLLPVLVKFFLCTLSR